MRAQSAATALAGDMVSDKPKYSVFRLVFEAMIGNMAGSLGLAGPGVGQTRKKRHSAHRFVALVVTKAARQPRAALQIPGLPDRTDDRDGHWVSPTSSKRDTKSPSVAGPFACLELA